MATRGRGSVPVATCGLVTFLLQRCLDSVPVHPPSLLLNKQPWKGFSSDQHTAETPSRCSLQGRQGSHRARPAEPCTPSLESSHAPPKYRREKALLLFCMTDYYLILLCGCEDCSQGLTLPGESSPTKLCPGPSFAMFPFKLHLKQE